MNLYRFCRQLYSGTLLAGGLLTASILQSSIGLAAQTNNVFNVVVNLNKSTSAFCRSNTGRGSYGATVTVVCETGEVVNIAELGNGMPWKATHGGAYRFITEFSTANDYRTASNDRGVGTVTSWRTVNLQDRDYIELLIGW